jgi:hypothetical protein
MSKVLYYYAKINENDVCYGFETLVKKFKEEELPSNLIPLVDYNESLLYRKWDRDLKAWSEEKYEPEIDAVLQERIQELEETNSNLIQENIELKLALAELAESNETKITELQIAIAELAERGA